MLEINLRVGEIVSQRKMTVSDFAERAKLNYKTAADLCKNRRDRVSLATLAAVCEALDVLPQDIFVVTKKD